jgi:hypothetical protein
MSGSETVAAVWHYYALFFVAGFFGTGAIFSPVMASVGSWFSVGMGTAIGIASAGQAMGQGGVPFVSSFLIKAFGVNGAFGATGLFMLVTLVPLAMLLRQPPAAPAGRAASGPVNDAAQIPVRTVIIRMSIATILCCSCMSVPLMHLVPLIQDRGFAAEQASSVIFVMLLVAIAGRLAPCDMHDEPRQLCPECVVNPKRPPTLTPPHFSCLSRSNLRRA